MRQVRGIVVRGVLGGDESDVRRHRCQGGEHGLGVRAPRNVQFVRAADVLAEPGPFAQEEGGEQARSAVWAMRRNDSKSVWEPDSAAFQMVPELTPWKKMPNWSWPLGWYLARVWFFPQFPTAGAV